MIKITSTKTHCLSVQGLTPKQLLVMGYILKGVSDRCYHEKIDGGTGDYVSGDDYVGMHPKEERQALKELAESLSNALDEFIKG